MQDLGEIPPEALHPAGPGAWQPVDGVDESIAPGVTTQPDAFYDEWDYRRGSWRHGWCHLYEMKAPVGDHEWVDEVRSRHAHLIRSIRRRFEALRGEDKPQKRQFDGEEIDLDAQVEARADRKSRQRTSPRLFIHRRRIERSLAVMFMVDMSGSTKGWVNDAERESLVLLCEAIEALGDSYAIYGFSGWTRTHCDIYPVKRFADRYDAETRRRIAGIEARDYTRMGVAVRHLSGLLVRRTPATSCWSRCPTAAPTTTATNTAAATASRTPVARCSKRARRASAATASPSTATAPTTCRNCTARRTTR
jgi:nitric oxide reductase NorD protein